MSTGLKASGEVVQHRSGGDPSTPIKLPGRTKYDSITLNRGVVADQSFSNWASQVWSYGSALGSEVSLANFRKDIYLDFLNEAGQLVVNYKISNGWVFERQILHNPQFLQHNLSLRPGLSLQEKLAAIFQESLERSSQRG
jgi:phage tail-like protein